MIKLFILCILVSITSSQDCTGMSISECFQSCRILYKGLKNFYNQTSRFCEPVTECAYYEQYNYLNNECIEYQHNLDFPTNLTSNSASVGNVITSQKISVPNIVCVNGYLITGTSKCICYTGWGDSQNSTQQIVYKCNIIETKNSTEKTNSTTSNETKPTVTETSTNNNTSNPIIDISESITGNNSNITLIVIIIVCVISLCCITCLLYTCYRCHRKNTMSYPGAVFPMQMANINNDCIRDIPIHNTLSNSVVRKLSYITPVKESRYIDYERPYESRRSHTMTYFDDDYFPRKNYIDRNLTDIPSRRIKYIEY